VLVVEDEPKVARALREGLGAEGYEVQVAPTGEDGFFRASSEPFDLLILDRMLPGREGLEVLQALRQKGHLAPVLVLTARDAVEDRVEGLDAGADDYLVKPSRRASTSSSSISCATAARSSRARCWRGTSGRSPSAGPRSTT
jgi:two-component system copper resistance phosphate regulon response regulator CusR